MTYTLKHFDTPVLKFKAESGAEPNIKIVWVSEKKDFLPLDLTELSDKGIESWLKHRTIPKNRAYVDSILSTMGLSLNRQMDIIKISKGLSLNDCYWITDENFNGTFDKYNLYENKFSRILGQIAFTGYGSNTDSYISSSPEFTTNGMLPKCWRRENGIVKLFKGGTEGASNTGNEPYSEYYASQIGNILGFNTIDYSLSKWKGRLCSVCDIFTSKEISYIPIGRLLKNLNLKNVKEFYENSGSEFVNALNEMFIFDALIFNTDRHYGNFGVLVDNNTNKIIAPAPLFDHGNSLFNFVGLDNLEDEKAFDKYTKNLFPCVYDDFILQAREVITHEQKNKVRALLDFSFKHNPRYNLPEKRLKLIQKAVSERAKDLIKQ